MRQRKWTVLLLTEDLLQGTLPCSHRGQGNPRKLERNWGFPATRKSAILWTQSRWMQAFSRILLQYWGSLKWNNCLQMNCSLVCMTKTWQTQHTRGSDTLGHLNANPLSRHIAINEWAILRRENLVIKNVSWVSWPHATFNRLQVLWFKWRNDIPPYPLALLSYTQMAIYHTLHLPGSMLLLPMASQFRHSMATL